MATPAAPVISPDVAPAPTTATPQTQVQAFGTDEPLWYQGAITPATRWAQAGYAVPNLGGKNYAINLPLLSLFWLIGRNAFEIFHEPDAKLIGPPNVKVLAEIHQLVIRARQEMAARAVPANQARFDAQHSKPAPQPFIVFPFPYFGDGIKQPQMREWAGLVLACLAEIAQHTAADLAYEMTADFCGMVGQYLQRIYGLMAVSFFGKDRTALTDPAFTLSADDFAKYNPAAWFTSVEMTDERPDLGWTPTSNDLRAIRGIAADQLIGLARFATGLNPIIGGTPTAANPVPTTPAASTGGFLPPPGPAILQQAGVPLASTVKPFGA